MANSLPFNAVAVDGEYDRVYKAEDWAWYFATFIANGIFPKPSDGLQVVAYSGMEIRVNAGYAFINGYAFRNPATLSVTPVSYTHLDVYKRQLEWQTARRISHSLQAIW